MADIRPAAAVLALLGSFGVGFSAYLDWLDGRAPDEIPIRLLVDDVTGEAPSYWRSLAVPLGIASVVGVLGVLVRSRGVLALAFIAGLGTFVWWIVREVDLRDELDVSDLEVGAWVLVASAAALLIGATARRRCSSAPRRCARSVELGTSGPRWDRTRRCPRSTPAHEPDRRRGGRRRDAPGTRPGLGAGRRGRQATCGTPRRLRRFLVVERREATAVA